MRGAYPPTCCLESRGRKSKQRRGTSSPAWLRRLRTNQRLALTLKVSLVPWATASRNPLSCVCSYSPILQLILPINSFFFLLFIPHRSSPSTAWSSASVVDAFASVLPIIAFLQQFPVFQYFLLFRSLSIAGACRHTSPVACRLSLRPVRSTTCTSKLVRDVFRLIGRRNTLSVISTHHPTDKAAMGSKKSDMAQVSVRKSSFATK